MVEHQISRQSGRRDTVAVSLYSPPGPVQWSVYVVGRVSGGEVVLTDVYAPEIL